MTFGTVVADLVSEDMETEFAWVMCGTEGDIHVIGPFFEDEDESLEAEPGICDHPHMVMRMTPRQMARNLPGDCYSIKTWIVRRSSQAALFGWPKNIGYNTDRYNRRAAIYDAMVAP